MQHRLRGERLILCDPKAGCTMYDDWSTQMADYRVLFYRTLLTSKDHISKHLLGQFDITSDSPSGALVLAEQQFQCDLADADRIEVMQAPSPGCKP